MLIIYIVYILSRYTKPIYSHSIQNGDVGGKCLQRIQLVNAAIFHIFPRFLTFSSHYITTPIDDIIGRKKKVVLWHMKF